jgi:hypothetical protein
LKLTWPSPYFADLFFPCAWPLITAGFISYPSPSCSAGSRASKSHSLSLCACSASLSASPLLSSISVVAIKASIARVAFLSLNSLPSGAFSATSRYATPAQTRSCLNFYYWAVYCQHSSIRCLTDSLSV